ncbi:ethanolamine utilization protein EutJ [Thalassobaculum fulvum]|uniref:Ethanolamine utilization protein EutJ n=1 Tax=Thalassobaculum fulvum TaxID=1633335 RepID=A0A919CQG9_9PROT|nr:ABC transporter substrate-binding protein [Thalassobaculum fulvum]GHD54797.1 ethanolamine utilization protein EutJ [Thalassobaculum fulvum]
MRRLIPVLLLSLAVPAAAAPALAAGAAEPVAVSVLVPITGFLALEGTAQRNGAVLALDKPPAGVSVTYQVADTATSPEVAVTALQRALDREQPVAVAAPIFGTQMLAMAPIADRAGVPLVTVSGTAKITELGHDVVFRFFPTDAVVKVAQARYAVQELGMKKPAVLYQTTAYGQSGREHLARTLKQLGVEPVLEEAIDPGIKDLVPALERARAAGADGLLLQLHSGPTALAVRQAHGLGLGLPVVAGSAMHQPTTAALLEPDQLTGVCAETASSPVSEADPRVAAFTNAYRERFHSEPDAFALGQYDGMRMVLAAVADGARSPQAVRDWLAGRRYQGLAMDYVSDGTGNMAHDAVIVCYDGTGRVPTIMKRYDAVDGVR